MTKRAQYYEIETLQRSCKEGKLEVERKFCLKGEIDSWDSGHPCHPAAGPFCREPWGGCWRARPRVLKRCEWWSFKYTWWKCSSSRKQWAQWQTTGIHLPLFSSHALVSITTFLSNTPHPGC